MTPAYRAIGGSTDGGSTDGGSTDGGSADGGSTDGGSIDDDASGFGVIVAFGALITTTLIVHRRSDPLSWLLRTTL